MEDIELAGETQVMDDYAFIEQMDTQLLDLSNDESGCENDGESEDRTKLLHDPDDVLDGCEDEIASDAVNGIYNCCQDGGETSTQSPPFVDTTQSIGSARRGITAVHTANRKASKNAEGGSCSPEFSCESLDEVTVNEQHDMEKGNGKRLSNKSKVARSLAGELLVEKDVFEEGSNRSPCGQRTELYRLPSCDNELAGLSYVDSQEPGELSQANAINFVDKFLKISVLDSYPDTSFQNSIGEIVIAGANAKGPQSLAQQANHRSIFAGATAFDWDDIHEDEGGGEFFIKRKEELVGTSIGAQKCSSRLPNSRLHEPRRSDSVGKLKYGKEQKNLHDKGVGSVNSNSKIGKSNKIGVCEGSNTKKDIDDHPHQGQDSDCSPREELAMAPNVELVDMLNVGIDTQMAAEAMEALSTGSALVAVNGSVDIEGEENGKELCKKKATKKAFQNKSSVRRSFLSHAELDTRSCRTRRSTMESHEESKSSAALRTHSKFVAKEINDDILKPEGSRSRLNLKNICAKNDQESSGIVPLKIGSKRSESALEQEVIMNGSLAVNRRSLRGRSSSSTSVARKTRQKINVGNAIDGDYASDHFRGQRDCLDKVQVGRVKRKRSTSSYLAYDNSNTRNQSLKSSSVTKSLKVDGKGASSNPGEENAEKKSLLASIGHDIVFQSIARRTRSKSNARCAKIPQEGEGLHCGKMLSGEDPCQLPSKKREACTPFVKEVPLLETFKKSPEEVQRSSIHANATPLNSNSPRISVSPICAGNEYPSPSCKKNLSLKKEFSRLTSNVPVYHSPVKDLRPKRDISSFRILFSQHLDEDVIRQQKKVLSRLGVPVASTISDATHFVADAFVRTRNMLEAIANGKPVVTHWWLDSCGQASCFIDEKNYILRDAKKEKELGFSMPISLARASRHPLLEGRRVFITANTKPDKGILTSLVKAVHGLAVERLGRYMSNNDRLLDELLVLSCEEDFEECVPLLEKGIAVYSSELLLNGILTQHLEYDRYLIFVDHVKKTRSTLWVKKDGEQFLPIRKAK